MQHSEAKGSKDTPFCSTKEGPQQIRRLPSSMLVDFFEGESGLDFQLLFPLPGANGRKGSGDGGLSKPRKSKHQTLPLSGRESVTWTQDYSLLGLGLPG